MTEYFNIVVGGEAGQGLLTVGNILSKALVRCGYHILVTKSYMSRIRGGHNTFAIRAGNTPVPGPQEQIDLLVALNNETADFHRDELSASGRIICDGSSGAEGEAIVSAPLSELGGKKTANIAALGVISGLLGLDTEVVLGTMTDTFGAKHPEMEEANRSAFAQGREWAENNGGAVEKLFQPENPEKRMMFDGNQSIALGAVSAGVKFCSFYPMTPATSIVQSLVDFKDKAGLEVLQVEDEIAAVNMALGAAFAGKPAMCATSGGGFALMTEGVSLAGITETPIVIAVAQRPGPATGLPTRTEQSDLEFVLRGGHGEFPRAVYAPSTVEDCFHVTRKAFEVAENYQGSTFVLTTQYLADSLRSVDPMDESDFDPVCPKLASPDEVAVPYERFAFTESGVSPRLAPGMSAHVVVADSDEHTPDGHITEDLDVRVRMVTKRLKKEEGIRRDVLPPEFYGPDSPEQILVTWGSAFGAAKEACDMLNAEGLSTGVLNFTQVWPLVPELFLDRLEDAETVIFVEENATGQFRRLIRSETGFNGTGAILRFDGLPMSAGYIMNYQENEGSNGN